MPAPVRTAHWGSCPDCLATVVVAAHPDGLGDIPDPELWETPLTCPVCDTAVDLGGSDPAQDITL